MAITDESRYQLFQGLTEALGPERAATLMELLPPVGWADVATKRDLDHLGESLRAEMTSLATGLRAEMASLATELRAEMTSLSTGLRAEMTSLSTEFRAEMTSLRTELRSDVETLRTDHHGHTDSLRAEFYRGQRNQILAIIGANTAITALLLTAFRFV